VGIKTVRRGQLYIWRCEFCGKEIYSLFRKQTIFNAKQHLIYCKKAGRKEFKITPLKKLIEEGGGK
jgi:ribosomal protein L37AE/L43A